MVTSREIRLKSRPTGMPSAENFELATVSAPDPAPGEVQVKNLWMTVDPPSSCPLASTWHRRRHQRSPLYRHFCEKSFHSGPLATNLFRAYVWGTEYGTRSLPAKKVSKKCREELKGFQRSKWRRQNRAAMATAAASICSCDRRQQNSGRSATCEQARCERWDLVLLPVEPPYRLSTLVQRLVPFTTSTRLPRPTRRARCRASDRSS